jgi:hypothetical protein
MRRGGKRFFIQGVTIERDRGHMDVVWRATRWGRFPRNGLDVAQSETKVMDIGATGVFNNVARDQGHPVSFLIPLRSSSYTMWP